MPGKLADRQIMTFADDEKAQGRPRIQIRTPSLDVKKDIDQWGATKDIKEKLERLNAKYKLAQELSSDHPLERKAFIYNLHTAINMFKPHDGSNKQSQGADYILKAAHTYNASQLGKKIPVFCYVQNLSVNGFGDSLGYEGNNALKNEATLMAEMAMLHNLVGKNDPQKEPIKQIFDKYQAYLQTYPRHAYFSETSQGREVKNLIQAVKTEWAKPEVRKVEIPEDMPAQDKTLEEAKVALKAMMAQNLHHGHQYAKLFQALSIYVEEASISGCKSGNERAQSINGRVSILDSVAVKREPGTDLIVLAINQLAKARPENIERKCDVLKRRLDKKYDKNLQAAAALISNVDQGAGAKLEAKTRDVHIDTNIGEEKGMVHLHQKGASLMQAHKGLTTGMAKNWPNEPRSFFDYITGGRMQGYERASTGGKIGKILGALLSAVASIVIFPVTLITYNNSAKETRRLQDNLDNWIERHKLRSLVVKPPVDLEKSISGFDLSSKSGISAQEEHDLSWKKNKPTATEVPQSGSGKKSGELVMQGAHYRQAIEHIKSGDKTDQEKIDGIAAQLHKNL